MKHWKNSDFFGFFYLRTPQNDTSGYHVLPKIIFSDSPWLELHFIYLSFLYSASSSWVILVWSKTVRSRPYTKFNVHIQYLISSSEQDIAVQN